MPWHLERREGKWCVIKDSDDSSAGCHDSRTDAIKQQRALYANESRVASMYAALDEATVEEIQEVVASPAISEESKASELVKIVVGNEQDKALTASVMQALENTNARLEMSERTTEALVAALGQLSQPIVNVAPADVRVDVPAPQVTIEPPVVNIQPPEVKVEIESPQVTVNPEIILPSESKKITFTRDPFSGRLDGAEITE